MQKCSVNFFENSLEMKTLGWYFPKPDLIWTVVGKAGSAGAIK